MKKIRFPALVLAILLSLSACSAPQAPEEVFAAVSEQMAGTKSAEFSVEMKLGADSGGFPLEMSVTGTGEVLADPQTVHMNVNVDLGVAQVDTQLYSRLREGVLDTCLGVSMGGSTVWGRDRREAAEIATPIGALKLLQTAQELEELPETETVNGIEGTRYSAVILGDDIVAVMDALDRFTRDLMGEGIDASYFREIVTPVARLPVSILIDRDELTLMEIRMDLSELLQVTTGAVPGLSFHEYTLTLRLQNLNGVRSIDIPPEAVNAPIG